MDEEPVLDMYQAHCSSRWSPSPCFCQTSSAFFVNSLLWEEELHALCSTNLKVLKPLQVHT